MSTTTKRTTPEGVVPRHQRSCTSRAGGACDCKPRWQAHAWDPTTRRKIRRTFRSSAEAKSWRAAATTAIERGQLRAGPVPTVAQAADELIAGMKDGSIRGRGGRPFKPSTVRGYEAALRDRIIPAIGRRRLSDVTRGDLGRVVERMTGEGCDASTIRNALVPVRLLYRRAVAAEIVTVNPTAALDLPTPKGRRDRIATPTEAAALLAALPQGDRALWATALYAGLRSGEIAGLDWRAVDLEGGVVVVERSWCPKSRTLVAPKSRSGRREVPIVAPLRALLLEHRLRTGRREGLVFGRDGERPFNASALRSRAMKAWKVAKAPPLACDVDAARREGRELPAHGYLTLHEGRHTYCSTLLAAGVSPAAVSRYAGHASVSFTLTRYVKALAGTEAGDAARVEAFLAAAGA